MKPFYLTLASWLLLASFITSLQANTTTGNPWTFIKETDIRVAEKSRQIVPIRYVTARLDVTAIQAILNEAPLWFTPEAKSKNIELSLPMPDGTFERFTVQYAPVMAPELAEKYPMIRAYAGRGIDDPTAYLRFDMTPLGFHASVYSAKRGTVVIDPYSSEDIVHYLVYYRMDNPQMQDWECSTEFDLKDKLDENSTPKILTDECNLRVYRLALACTGEFAQACGGTESLVMATFNTIMMHVNGIFEREVNVTMNLIANTDILIFTNSIFDPYDNDNLSNLLWQNDATCNLLIHAPNYDIGHVFATCNGGAATVESVCNDLKARGASGTNGMHPYFGFSIRTVAHEMGHQFGARHTFNDCGNNQQLDLGSSVEPGSGSTIMGYAGTGSCSTSQYVKEYPAFADEYFHAKSLEEIESYVQSIDCQVEYLLNNDPPVANAGINYIIPKSTPFVLTALGIEENDDNDTYCWEQMNPEQVETPLLSSDTTGPAFRSYLPTTSPRRYFPALPFILNNANIAQWEVLPSVGRNLNFRLTVRDALIFGCPSNDDMVVTVAENSGPFAVSSPNSPVNWPALSQQVVTWDVANTTASPVDCDYVDILLSVDGGLTFPIALATATPNDGSQTVTLPNLQTIHARIMVRSSGNIFFDVSNAKITITAPSYDSCTPNIQWQNTIGGNGIDGLNSIQQTSNGEYILFGESNSNISGDKTENNRGAFRDNWVVKLNSSGNIQWEKTIGGSSEDNLGSIQQTSDGGYIFGGRSFSNISGEKTENSKGSSDCWVVKLDAAGNIQWQKTIGGSNYDELNSIQNTSDGGYIFGAGSNSNISGDKTENNKGNVDYWVVKLNTSGNIQWQKTIGGSDREFIGSIQQTSEGGYIIGGSSGSNISGDKTENNKGDIDYWVVKLNISGIIQWQKTIGGSGREVLRSIQQTSDGGYIIGGDSNSNISGDKTEDSKGSSDYWVVKLDATGSIQWQKTIGGSSSDELYSAQQTSEGGYIIGGSSWSEISGDKTESNKGIGEDCWIIKLDTNGNILWQNTIGGSSRDYLFSLKQTSDDGYILGGPSISDISEDKTENSQGDYDYWVIKLSPDGNPSLWYKDTDNDGYSNGTTLAQCTQPDNYQLASALTATTGDCNDNDNSIYPGAPELCDGKDNNCNGSIDENGAISGQWSAGGVGTAGGGTSSGCSGSGGAGSTPVFNVGATGNSTSSSDNMQFIYQTLCGDGSIVTHINSVAATGGWAGVIMRENLSTGSRKAGLKKQATSGVFRDIRITTGGAATITPVPFSATHTWLRIVRTGNTFSLSTSTNGTTWGTPSNVTIAMPNCIYVGMYVESINAGTTTNAVFDHVAVTGNSNLIAPFEQGIQVAQPLQVKVYPNPTTGQTTIEFNILSTPTEVIRWSLYQSNGTMLMHAKATVESQSFDLSSFADGLYWLRIETEGLVPVMHKLIKTRGARE